MSNSRSSNQGGSSTTTTASGSGQESSFASRPPGGSRLLPQLQLTGNLGRQQQQQQRATVQAVTVRQQFAALLAGHFDAAEAAGDGGAAESASTPRAGKGGHGRRFRGVTRHKRTQRFESHIWEMKKQIYLGGFDTEPLAAKAHDVMALRCKDCSAGDGAAILNFPRSSYASLLPLVEKLSREEVITALRNYSKGQTSKRMGAPTPPAAPRPRPTAAAGKGPSAAATSELRATAGGGVRKPGSPRVGGAALRLPSGLAPSSPGAAAAQRKPLSVRIVGAPRPRESGNAPTSSDESISRASSASPSSPRGSLHKVGFGGKVAPRGRMPPGVAAAAAAAAAATPTSTLPTLKQRLAGGQRSPPRSPKAEAPATPHGVLAQPGAPTSPTAAAAAGTPHAVVGMRCRYSGALAPAASGGRAMGTATGTYLGPAVPGGSAGAAAPVCSGQVLSAGGLASTEAHKQYVAELYKQYSQQAPQPTPAQQQQRSPLLWPHGASTYAAAAPASIASACRAAAAAASGKEGGPGSSQGAVAAAAADVAAAELAGGGPRAFGEDLMEVDGCAFNRLLEEPSLTFSASDDAYLFAPTPAHASTGTALEHVNGTVLFQEEGQGQAQRLASSGSDSSGSHPASGGKEGGAPLPDWHSLVLSSKSAIPVAAQQQRQQSLLLPNGSDLPAILPRPASPGQLIPVLPAASVPAPPATAAPASFSATRPPLQLASAESAASVALRQASLRQQLHLAALQRQPSLFTGSSPFAPFTDMCGSSPAGSGYFLA